MTTITAKILADSVSPAGVRLTSMSLRYPRPIHAEFMTHRVFSRNASSSRAIPVERLIQDVLDDPFVPLHWGANQKGMQADEECDAPVILEVEDFFNSRADEVEASFDPATRQEAWIWARDQAVEAARAFAEAGYHKQIVNRLLEPFAHINVVVTGTDWANFLHLRDHRDAEPHIAILASEVRTAMIRSEPVPLSYGDWHLPYVDQTPGSADSAACWEYGLKHDLDLMDVARRLSVARCASVSYKTVDGKDMTIERAVDLYDKLVGAEPLHASPTEHQATPDMWVRHGTGWGWQSPEFHGNLRGWRQFRKTLPNENVTS